MDAIISQGARFLKRTYNNNVYIKNIYVYIYTQKSSKVHLIGQIGPPLVSPLHTTPLRWKTPSLAIPSRALTPRCPRAVVGPSGRIVLGVSRRDSLDIVLICCFLFTSEQYDSEIQRLKIYLADYWQSWKRPTTDHFVNNIIMMC